MKAQTSSVRKMVLIISVYYIITSVAAGLLGGLQPATHIPDVIMQITQLGPTLGVLAVLVLFRKDVRPFLNVGLSVNPRVLKRLLAAAGIFAAIFALSVVWFRLFGRDVHYTHPATLAYPFWIIVVFQFIGAGFEELGWRCFLQPYLQARLSVLASSLIVGLLWGLWHIGVFADGLVFAGSFMVSAIAISVILGELLRGVRSNNLIIAAVFHGLVNLGLLLLFTEEGGDVFSMATVAAACSLAAIVTVYLNKVGVRWELTVQSQ